MSKQLPTAASDKIFKLAMQYKNITIEGASSREADANAKRAQVWKYISETVNSAYGTQLTPAKAKKHFHNRKSSMLEAERQEKRQVNTTGEGRNVAVERAASQCTAIESELLDFLKKSPVIKTPKGADTLRLAAMSEDDAVSDDEESNRIDLEEPGPSSKKAKQKQNALPLVEKQAFSSSEEDDNGPKRKRARKSKKKAPLFEKRTFSSSEEGDDSGSKTTRKNKAITTKDICSLQKQVLESQLRLAEKQERVADLQITHYEGIISNSRQQSNSHFVSHDSRDFHMQAQNRLDLMQYGDGTVVHQNIDFDPNQPGPSYRL